MNVLSGISTDIRLAWGRRSARERWMLSGAGAFLAGTLVWQYLWLPAYENRRALEQQIPQLQQQLAIMRKQAAAALPLASRMREPPPQGNVALQQALQHALVQQGWPDATATLQGSEVQITVPRASFATWIAWLLEVQQHDRIEVNTAHITALKPAGQVEIHALLGSTT